MKNIRVITPARNSSREDSIGLESDFFMPFLDGEDGVELEEEEGDYDDDGVVVVVVEDKDEDEGDCGSENCDDREAEN